jgi:hypothetical protein
VPRSCAQETLGWVSPPGYATCGRWSGRSPVYYYCVISAGNVAARVLCLTLPPICPTAGGFRCGSEFREAAGMILNRLVLFLSLLAPNACAVPPNFSMYPEALAADRSIEDNMAVILVGNLGPAGVDYLQFEHSSLPAINVHGINLLPDSIAAVPIPVGTRSLSLSSYTIGGRSRGYLPNGMNFGYIPVHSPGIDIDSHGLYYTVTLFPGSQRNYVVAPNATMLERFRRNYPQLAKLKPINFNWPS